MNILNLLTARICCTYFHLVGSTLKWLGTWLTSCNDGLQRLAKFNFTMEHIPGESNIWSDIVTRWAAPGFDKSPARRLCAIKVPLQIKEKLDLSSLEVIAKSQEKYPLLKLKVRLYLLMIHPFGSTLMRKFTSQRMTGNCNCESEYLPIVDLGDIEVTLLLPTSSWKISTGMV